MIQILITILNFWNVYFDTVEWQKFTWRKALSWPLGTCPKTCSKGEEKLDKSANNDESIFILFLKHCQCFFRRWSQHLPSKCHVYILKIIIFLFSAMQQTRADIFKALSKKSIHLNKNKTENLFDSYDHAIQCIEVWFCNACSTHALQNPRNYICQKSSKFPNIQKRI